MKFQATQLEGAFIVEPEPHTDARGFFARMFCREEFAAHGLEHDWRQSNLSYNARRGTLRGMHWQAAPHGEAKLVRCQAGAIHDVIVDLRPESKTLGQWIAVELSRENHRALYVPQGFAHGFLTLSDESEVFYEMGAAFVAESARGFRWDDPRIGIEWPTTPEVLSDRDASYSDLPQDLADLAGVGS